MNAQPPPIPPDLFLMLMLFVGGLVGIIIFGIILLIIGYAYKRSIKRQAGEEGVSIDDYSPSRRLQNTCGNWWVILLCVLLIVMIVAPGLFVGSIIVFSVQILWGFLYFWAFGIPIFMIIITAIDMLYYRSQLNEARSESIPSKSVADPLEPASPAEHTARIVDFCNNCNEPLSEETQFCSNCGKKT